MATSSYYIMAIAIAAAFFFIVWGILNDYGADTPWITAGVGASIVVVGSVVFREGFLKRSKLRVVRIQSVADDGKLTIELNTRILKEIKKRSDAANVLAKIPAAHREVFELCSEYLSRVEAELKALRSGSPRLEPILNGRKKVSKLHRFHMLRWAEIEATALTQKAQRDDDIGRRVTTAAEALETVETALQAYPAERALQESHSLLNELVVSMAVSEKTDQAIRAEENGDLAKAIAFHRDALTFLATDNIQTPEREQAAARIHEEMERIRQKQQR